MQEFDFETALVLCFETRRRALWRMFTRVMWWERWRVDLNATAEDLVQATFLRAFEKQHLFSGDSQGAFEAWVFKIARNILNGERKTRWRRKYDNHTEITLFREEERGLSVEPPRKISFGNGSEQAFVGRVFRLHNIPNYGRFAFFQHEVEGRPCGEIAAQIGLSLGKTRQAIDTARSALQQRARDVPLWRRQGERKAG
jgi:RNA polymerase sigma factor (sigma-70 family)